MSLLLTILVSISLSMDTFSLSLAYGTMGLCNREKYFLSGLVGLFHYCMPILGFSFGKLIMIYISASTDTVLSIVFSLIGIEMIFSSFNEKEVKRINGFGYFLFALAVSLDSFSVGITINNIYTPLLFSLFSFIFTLFGLNLGNKIASYFGKISTTFGGIVLLVIGFLYYFGYL